MGRPEPARVLVQWPGPESVWVRRLGAADVDAAGDWIDVHLQGDYFFRRRHLRGILLRGNSEGWGVEVEGELVGVVILYNGSRLHNLYLAPEWRGKGLGAALLAHFKPTTVRAKTNMLAADPTGFYERQGYRVVGQDAKRPWILEMALDGGTAVENIAQNRPGQPPRPPGGPGVQVPAATLKRLGLMSVEQVKKVATALRALSDDELVAMAETAAQYRHWKVKQEAARFRRLERERAEAAAAAGQHLSPDLTGEARARVARAKSAQAIDALWGTGSNGQAIPPHSE